MWAACWEPALLTDKVLVPARPRLKHLCRWGQSEVRQYNRSLGITSSCFCSVLTVPQWSWASSTLLGTPQEWGEWEGSRLLFSYPAGNAPALHSKVPAQSTFFCCVHPRVRSSRDRSWFFGEIISAAHLMGELVSRGGATGMRKTEKNPAYSVSPITQRLSTVAIFWYPSINIIQAEKVLLVTSFVVLQWFFLTLSGWHWNRQWEEGICGSGDFSLS